jgi:hypothetical protein
LPAALSPARYAGASGTWRSSPVTLVVKLLFVAKAYMTCRQSSTQS